MCIASSSRRMSSVPISAESAASHSSRSMSGEDNPPMGRVTRRHPVLGLGPGEEERRRVDVLAVEEPLEIRLDGEPFVVTMRTPGDDIDLVHGLLHAEGVITAAEQISTARYCGAVGPNGENPYNQ